jgi:hypothetical protein
VSLDRILFKLKKVKKFLKGWGFNLSGTRKRRKKEVAEEMADLETLEEGNTLSHDHLRRKVELKTELLHILEEELYWFKRSHENWLLKGDNNTEYFHRIANGNKRKQTIYFLKDGDNSVQGSQELLNPVTEYYKGLFGPRAGNMFDIDPNLWQNEENVTTSENDSLIRPFLENEIKVALF